MIKFIFKTILTILFLLVLGLVGAYFYAGEIAKKAVETYVPQITKTSAKLEGMDLSFMKGEISLNGLEISNPQGFKSPDVFSVKKIYVRIDPKSVLTDKIVIEQILVDGTHVSAEATYKDGEITSNITKIQKNVEEYLGASQTTDAQPVETKKEVTKTSSSSKRVVIKDLQINNTSLTLGLMDQTAEIGLPNIEQKNIGEKGKKQTIKETVAYIFNLISLESIKASVAGAQDLLKKTAENALQGVTDVVDEAKKNPEGLINAVKNIF